MFGVAAGLTPLLIHYQAFAENCVLLDGPACASASLCHWEEEVAGDGGGRPRFADGVDGAAAATNGQLGVCSFLESCAQLSTNSECLEHYPFCSWNPSTQQCHNVFGWMPSRVGLFAAMFTLGTLLGSICSAGSTRGTRKRDCAYSGIACLLGLAMIGFSWFPGMSIPFVFFSRLLIGFGCGAAGVVVPLYCAETCPVQWRTQSAAMFQVFLTFGVALLAKIGYSLERDLRGTSLLFFICAIVCGQFLVVLLIQQPAMDVQSPFPVHPLHGPGFGSAPTTSSSSNFAAEDYHVAGAATPMRSPAGMASFDAAPLRGFSFATISQFVSKYKTHIKTACWLSVAQQCTGIAAIFNFAPSIASSAGLGPLQGSFYVTAWNFLTTPLALPLARRYTPKSLFLFGTLSVSCCAIICALGMHPLIVSSPGTRLLVVATGILGFLLSYGLCLGPFFNILATELFPIEVRDQGCSLTNVFQAFASLVVSVSFPSLVAFLGDEGAEAGGAGMSKTFLLFALVGFGSFAMLRRILFLPTGGGVGVGSFAPTSSGGAGIPVDPASLNLSSLVASPWGPPRPGPSHPNIKLKEKLETAEVL
jgi:SP family arabinose:H+ symporter-like MFS transporter